MKKVILVMVVLGLAGLGAYRATQVLSVKKEDPKKPQRSLAPLVEVVPVTPGLLEERITRTGDIVPESQVTVYSKTQGWVDKINVREGDRVKAGQLLVSLDSREARAAVAQSSATLEAALARLKQVRATSEEAIQSQINQTRAGLELAESDLRRAQELHQKNFIARQQLDEARTRYNVAKAGYDLALNSLKQKTWENDIALAEAQVRQARATLDLTQAQLDNLSILSPMEGMVTRRHVDPGTMVKDTTAILTLMDTREVKMVVNVIEKEFLALQKGQSVKVTVPAFPQQVFPGRVTVITPALELQSRTAEIQISIPNPNAILNPGMFGRAEILLRSNPRAILIPIQAVVNEGAQDFVYVVLEGKALRRPIRKGAVKDASVEVLQGLKEGEKVVVAGHGLLKDGIPVRLMSNPQKG